MGSSSQVNEASYVSQPWKKQADIGNIAILLTQVEAILNSRPITSDLYYANDALALLPGHFLLGRPITTLPEPTTVTVKETTTLTRQMEKMDNFIRDF